MKTSVRFLSLLLAVLMIAGAALTASAEKTDKIANEEALSFLVNLGIFGGYDDGTLKPDNLVQRDEMAKIIFVLYTTFNDTGKGVQVFADVPADNWAAGYVSWAAANNIVGGYGNGKFGPDDNVTYDQALKMVCGALGYKDWDSNLWPTDVRRLALTTLDLGENISGVKGSDYVTRAQIAQIVYNALYANMNETKKGNYGIEIPMTLISDVWGVTETSDAIIATENLSCNGADATGEADEIVLDDAGSVTLEELGLAKYAGKTDELIKAQVNVIKRGDDVVGTSVISIYADDVKFKTDKENKVYLNDVELDEEELAALKQISISKAGVVSEVSFVLPSEELEYVANVIDVDADGVYDLVEWHYYSAYEVSTIGKTSTTFAPITGIGTGSSLTIDNEAIVSSASYAEDDVVVLIDRKFEVEVVDVVKPVTSNVTKFGNGKMTLADAGEFEVNVKIFDNVNALALTQAIMAKDDKGENIEFNFYAKDGVVFYAPSVEEAKSAYNFAVLAYVTMSDKPVLDVETKEFNSAYTAVLVIDGKETSVPLNATETIFDVSGTPLAFKDEYDRATILAKYGKTEHIIDKYLQAPYTLVTYKIDEDGYYTLRELDVSDEDYVVLKPGAEIDVDNIGFYAIDGTDVAEDSFADNRILIDDATALYYTYTKEDTGAHKYLGIYTADNIPDSFATITTAGYTYLVKPEGEKLYTLVATLLGGKLEAKSTGGASYKTDARLIKYCYASSQQELVIDAGNKIYNSYSFMDINTLKNGAQTVDTRKAVSEGAVAASAGHLYAYDEDLGTYVKINKESAAELGVTSVSTAKLVDVWNGFIFTDEGEYSTGVKLPDSAVLWTFQVVASSGHQHTDSYRQLTLNDLANSLAIAKKRGSDMRLIFFTYEDGNGEKQISSVAVEFFSYGTYNVVRPHSPILHNNFGA